MTPEDPPGIGDLVQLRPLVTLGIVIKVTPARHLTPSVLNRSAVEIMDVVRGSTQPTYTVAWCQHPHHTGTPSSWISEVPMRMLKVVARAELPGVD